MEALEARVQREAQQEASRLHQGAVRVQGQATQHEAQEEASRLHQGAVRVQGQATQHEAHEEAPRESAEVACSTPPKEPLRKLPRRFTNSK